MTLKSLVATKPSINLAGPGGNAFALLGNAEVLAEKLGLDPRAVMQEMQGGDYVEMVRVFDRHFGQVVDLLVPESLQKRLLPTGAH